MNKEIQYAGYTTEPSDYECADGQLATSLNLISEDEQLKPVFQPKTKFQLSADKGSCVFIHETSSFKHYILAKGEAYSWFDEDHHDTITSIGNVSDYISVTSVGNTLIFLTENGMQYYLWKGGTTGYLYLGSKIPECPLSFGLQGEMVRTDEFTITFDKISWADVAEEFSDDNKTKITEQVLAKVNKFIADESTHKGRFIFPFFVRYAYRLFDGTLTMHSAPILMIASSDLTPQVFFEGIDGAIEFYKASLRVAGMVHRLDYAVLEQSYIDNLSEWKDIVRSVDIFCSNPIYTYDQSGKCERFAKSTDINTYCVCKHTNQAVSTTTYPLRYQKHTFNKLYAFTFNPTDLSFPAYRLLLPSKSVDTVKENIKSTSQFYLLDSIKLEKLTTTRTLLNINEDYLQSLATREAMTDDYDSHDTVVPRYAFPYNSRLNIANMKKILFSGYNAAAQFCYTDGYVWKYEGAEPTIADGTRNYSVYVHIKQDGKDIVVHGGSCSLAAMEAPMLFIYYPNVNAYKATISGFIPTIEVPLEQHGFLNGAFYFGGWDNPTQQGAIPSVSTEAERTINVLNKIYTSDVNNPFFFPLLGINTVGTGEIKGISSAAKALSQGQFGQFPLYAFTTEGVWALETSTTGTYSARQPITRDVCTNADGITQLDSAVLFPTDRGIMLISGSQTQCITDSIFTEAPFDVLDLPGMDKVHAKLGDKHASDACVPVLPFIEFLGGCRMVYDYVHQRIIVFNPALITQDGTTKPRYTYAYVYSLKSRRWGMTYSDLASTLNSYPEALAMTQDNRLVSFAGTDESESKGLFVTRPLKLEAADVHKTISCVIQRGHFNRGDVATILYGSRDLYNWHLVWSSKDQYLRGFRGTPYKFFRIAGLTTLSDGKSLFGTSINFEYRLNNQLR